MSLYLQYWLGIDFGTYNSSAVIRTQKGEIEIIKGFEESIEGNVLTSVHKQEKVKAFPSFISFRKDGSLEAVGLEAKNKIYTDPEYVVWGIKRLLGKTYTELKESGELDRFLYRIRPDRTNGQCVIIIGEKSYTPIQLCAEILKKIKKDAEKQNHIENINSVIVSVPAYFDPLRVTPIVEAARLAGFINIKTIPEPVAAALAYHIEITARPIKVLVFDLGAGTLDVTVGYLFRQGDTTDEFTFQAAKNTGDAKLGGIDMDDRLEELIKEKCALTGVARGNTAFLRRVAEIAKIRLSEEPQIEQVFQFLEKEYRFQLTQMEFKSVLEGRGPQKDLLEACRRQIMAAIEEAGLTPQEIELFIPIGGPTKLPCVYEIFRIIFYSNPAILHQLEEFYSGKEKVDRMTSVSIGAGMSIDRKVEDNVPYGCGIEDADFINEEMVLNPKMLIPRDSSYPFKSEHYAIGWVMSSGLFEFKIIQHLPKSEIQNFGYEYKFVGMQKFAVKDPDVCRIVVQMGYNSNKELEVMIRNVLSTYESVTYVGINQFNSVGVNYPLAIKKTPSNLQQKSRKVPPSPETVDEFIKWVRSIITFVQRKIDNQPVRQPSILQMLDEISLLLKKEDKLSVYESVYSKMNSVIWNCSSNGLLAKSEYDELSARLNGFEGELFKTA